MTKPAQNRKIYTIRKLTQTKRNTVTDFLFQLYALSKKDVVYFIFGEDKKRPRAAPGCLAK